MSGGPEKPGAAPAPVKSTVTKKTVLLVFFLAAVAFITLFSLSLAMPAKARLDAAGQKDSDSRKKMFRIGQYLMLYAAKHNMRLPEKLSQINGPGYLENISWFDSNELPGKVLTAADIDAGTDFIYVFDKNSPLLDDTEKTVLRENKDGGLVMTVSKQEIKFK
jgi:hypothetical protein